MKETQPGYYAIIPAPIRYAEDLSEFEKLLYGEITALADKYGYCFASNSYFGNLYKKSTAWISKKVNHMTKLGYLKLDYDVEAGNTRKIYIGELAKITSALKVPIKQKYNRAIVEKNKGGIEQKNKTPIAQKCNHNNTSINTTRVNGIEDPPTQTPKFEFINGMRDVEVRGSYRLKNWNEKTGKSDLLNSEIKKAMYDIMKNVTAEEFGKRVENYVNTVQKIDKFKLRSYVFFPIWDWDLLMFLTHINKFYGEIATILSKIAKLEYKTKIVNMIKEQPKQEPKIQAEKEEVDSEEEKKVRYSKLKSIQDSILKKTTF